MPSITAAVEGPTSWECDGVVRFDSTVPFFMNNDVFTTFSKPNYSWDVDSKRMILLGSKNTVSWVPRKLEQVDIDYSVGGCPLECPFDPNEDFEEALDITCVPEVFDGVRVPNQVKPLLLQDGREATRKVREQVGPFVDQLSLSYKANDCPIITKETPVFALVNGPEIKSGLALSGFKRPFQSFDVFAKGKHKPTAEILQMKTLRLLHEDNLFASNKPISSQAHAIYEKIHGEYPSKGKVYLEFLFKNPTDVFEIPPEDSLCKIVIRPLQGDANPSMKALWEEVEDLERWANMITTVSSNSFADCTAAFMNATTQSVDIEDMSENMIAVKKLLTEQPVMDLHRTSAMEFSDSLDLVLKRTVEQKRADCDFTDRLWCILRKCANVGDLYDCLRLVLQAVADKMYRPYLLLTNNTLMAKNLKLIMKGEIALTLRMLRQEMMIKLLIECGLMKLFKDYNFALGMSHLIERGDVDVFLPVESDIPNSISNIKKLHCILEVMCLSKERLTLSINHQEGHVKNMINYFSKNPVSWDKIFHFDVPPNDIRRLMTGLHPIYFKVKMDSQTSLVWATTTAVISPEAYINLEKISARSERRTRDYFVYLCCESGRITNM